MKNWETLEPDIVKILPKHYTPGRGGRKIRHVTIHHMAMVGGVHECYQVWLTRPASGHYCIDPYGIVGQAVRLADTAWGNANLISNQETVVIEHSNSAGAHADWPISDATLEAGAHLVAAICKRQQLGRPVSGKNVRFHNIESGGKTECPYHLRPGHKYHDRYIARAQYWYDVMAGATPPPNQEGRKPVVEKRLDYPRNQITQDTFYNCGPASTQTVVLAATGKLISESALGKEMGTHRGGTDWIGLIKPVLNKHIPGGAYQVMEMPNDPPTPAQKTRLWEVVKASIDAGYGCVANIVAPPSNYPRASYTSTINLQYRGGTVYHYVAVMGYAVDSAGLKHVWLADSGFSPYGSWITFDQLSTLIPPKGIAYSTAKPKVASPAVEKPKPAPVAPKPQEKEKNVTTLDTVMRSHVAGSTHEAPLADYIMYIDRGVYDGLRRMDEHYKALSKQIAALSELLTKNTK